MNAANQRANKAESVARGGASFVLARILGMALSFILFLVLARHSDLEAGIFRTVVTYILIAEFLAMLGLHRWLATELAPVSKNRWPIFLATCAFTLIISVLLSTVFVVISYSGLYSGLLNEGIRLSALAVIPSGLLACVQSAFIGIGNNQRIAKLLLAENTVRCLLGMLLIIMHRPVIEIVMVFVISRWIIALWGFFAISKALNANHWRPDPNLIKLVAIQAPRFALIIFSFLVLKNIAMLMLPALHNESEVTFYAVSYQLFDLILILPSVLATTTNNLFVTKAGLSTAALKKSATQLIWLTTIVMFPIIAVTAAYAPNFLQLLYGNKYLASVPVLMWLMLAAAMMMVDQVLSQIMLAKKAYHQDMQSIVIGGLSAAIFTGVLAHYFAATGASIALVIALTITVATRLYLLVDTFSLRLLWLTIKQATIASLAILVLSLAIHHFEFLQTVLNGEFLWMLFIAVSLIIYIGLLYVIGGLNQAKISRARLFLFHH